MLSVLCFLDPLQFSRRQWPDTIISTVLARAAECTQRYLMLNLVFHY